MGVNIPPKTSKPAVFMKKRSIIYSDSNSQPNSITNRVLLTLNHHVMKRSYTIFLLVSFFMLFQIAKSETIILYNDEANKKFAGAELVRLKDYSKIPNYIKFSKGNELPLSKLTSWVKQYCSEGKEQISFQLIQKKTDELGYVHYRFQQTYQGIPLENAYYIAHEKDGFIQSLNGEIIHDFSNLNTQHSLSQTTALNRALKSIGAKKYKWEIPEEEKFIKREQNNLGASFFPKGQLTIIHQGGDFKSAAKLKLAYKFDIYAHEPMSRNEVFVDANTGAILYTENLIHDVDVSGTAQTAYSGSQTIQTEASNGAFRLTETGRGNGIETYNMMRGTSYGSAVDFTDTDNNWNNANSNKDQYATDAHWGTEMTYDYYLNVHSQNSIDGNGFKLRNYVHYRVNYVNAFWDGTRMTYGDGNSSYTPLTSLDIIGHEITHGLTSNTADLVYQNESGALNESFSDIFGVSIDFSSRPSQANFLIGEEITLSNNPFRSMENPNDYNDPDTYQGTHWYSGSGDHGGVHTNSGVQNFWYYLMVNGGNGINDINNSYNVQGIGIEKAEKIAFRSLTNYLTANSDYSDARFYAIQAATDLYGSCSPELETTTNAWYAVGVGSAYSSGADFQADATNSCSLPFSAHFTTSSNSASYIWNFGDGSSSNQQNPNHTFTQTGSYTVSLSVSGGACGSDTVTKVNYITIDTVGGCPVILPAGGTAPTQTACNGLIYDNGGPNGNYSANQNTYITIDPSNGNNVTLTFPLFDVEQGIGNSCDYDFLSIYDGPNINSPLIGKYCNTTGNPGTLTSTNGPITLYFHSDPGLQLSGFKINWTCSSLNNPAPIANFSANDTIICQGNSVNFTSSSSNASSYQWSFPGGTPSTSSVANPVVQYQTSGYYTASLSVYNNSGTNSITKQNYIHVGQAPQAIFTNTNNGLNVSFNNTSIGASSWLWNFGDGSSSTQQNPTHTYANPGTYTVCLISSNSFCSSNSSCNSLTVVSGSPSNPPVAAFSANDTSICNGYGVVFTSSSVNATSYQWSFPGGNPSSSTLQNPIITYNTAGIYPVTLTVINAYGTDTAIKQNYIHTAQNVNASFTKTANGLTMSFTNTSTGATSWAWDFGDGTTSTLENPTHTFANSGIYQVCLRASNAGCPSSQFCFLNLQVTGTPSNNAPIANLSTSQTNVCEGSSITFSDQSTSNPTSWNWTFLGGNPSTSTQQNPVISYANSGIYNVQLIVSNNNGSDTILLTNYITINSTPSANYTYAANGLSVNYTNQSTGGATSWLWSFGDGNYSNQTSPQHTYTQPGNYSVCLTASNPSCNDDIKCDSVHIFPTSIEGRSTSTLLKIFPNPTHQKLNVQLKGNTNEKYYLKLTDGLGRILIEKKYQSAYEISEQIDVSNLPSGTYILMINNSGHKVMINH